MLPKPNEGNSKVNDYLKSLEVPEGKPIPKDEKPKKEVPKNDANNEYEYSDDTETDDTKW